MKNVILLDMCRKEAIDAMSELFSKLFLQNKTDKIHPPSQRFCKIISDDTGVWLCSVKNDGCLWRRWSVGSWTTAHDNFVGYFDPCAVFSAVKKQKGRVVLHGQNNKVFVGDVELESLSPPCGE